MKVLKLSFFKSAGAAPSITALLKSFESLDGIAPLVRTLLDTIQSDLFSTAQDRMVKNTVNVDTWEEFQAAIHDEMFVMAHWDGTSETEDLISDETKASIRCLPFDGDLTPGVCIKTGNPSARRVLFAKSY